MVKSLKYIKKTAIIVYGVILGAILGLLIYIGCSKNIERYDARQHVKYTQPANITAYQKTEIMDANAPLGVKTEYKWELGEILNGDVSLAFYAVHQQVEVYIDDEKVYAVVSADEITLTDSVGSNWIVVPLYPEDTGTEIRVEVTPMYKDFIDRDPEFYIGSLLILYVEQMRNDLPQILISIIATVCGLFFMIFGIYNWGRRIPDKYLIGLGFFSVAMGVWRLTDTRFSTLLFSEKPVLMFYMSLAMLMIGTTPLIFTIQHRSKLKHNEVLDVCLVGTIVVSTIQVVLQVLNIADFRETLMFSHASILISSITMIVLIMFESVMYERKIEKKRLSKLYLLCVGGVVCDLIAYYIKGDSNDLLFSLMGFVLYTIIIGIDMIAGYVEQERKLEMQRVELANSRMAIMISQIQPHFLYNVLNSIHYLCEKDPKTAQKAIGEFSDYLRVNLDSINRKVPVPFETELKHVKTYLKLEKMRFGDELQIVYDIQVQSFLIPSLTLQPIAENAVKHGVGKKTGGGTVWIRTEENADCYMVVVEDDGVGYAPQQTTDDGRSHIGVENVGKRLKEMVQGSLTIERLEQGGTKAVISIPKQKEEN